MHWSDVIADPALRDLPYKIELNKWGIIEMSPSEVVSSSNSRPAMARK